MIRLFICACASCAYSARICCSLVFHCSVCCCIVSFACTSSLCPACVCAVMSCNCVVSASNSCVATRLSSSAARTVAVRVATSARTVKSSDVSSPFCVRRSSRARVRHDNWTRDTMMHSVSTCNDHVAEKTRHRLRSCTPRLFLSLPPSVYLSPSVYVARRWHLSPSTTL